MIHRFRKEAPNQFWLTDAQFSKIAPHLPADTRGKARVDDRRVISGIVHVLKSGGRWIDAPPEYGPKKTLYNRYVRWAAKGVWVNLFQALAQAGGPPTEVLIDSSAMKAHRSASGGNVWPAPSASRNSIWTEQSAQTHPACRNRHCPKCQGAARAAWLEARKAELLPTPYFHVVFTLPPAAAEIAFQNKALVYALLMRSAAKATMTLAENPKRLGAKIGLLAVLHIWGQTLTHHPHVHCVVPGGGVSLDGNRWIASKLGFFLPVKALARLFQCARRGVHRVVIDPHQDIAGSSRQN